MNLINNEIPLDDIETRKQFLDLAKKLKRENLKSDFLNWSKNSLNDLESGIFLIAQFDNPLLDIEHYVTVLNNWAVSLSTNLKKIKLFHRKSKGRIRAIHTGT